MNDTCGQQTVVGDGSNVIMLITEIYPHFGQNEQSKKKTMAATISFIQCKTLKVYNRFRLKMTAGGEESAFWVKVDSGED